MPPQHPPRSPRMTPDPEVAYELVTVDEGRRCKDEVVTVRSVFGAPVDEYAKTWTPDNATPLVIVGSDWRRVVDLLTDLRSRPASVLRPTAVVWAEGAGSGAREVEKLADALVGPHADNAGLQQLRDELSGLSVTTRTLSAPADDPPMLLLQFLFSRRSELSPLLDPEAPLAYRYPLAERVLSSSTAAALDVLDDLAEHGLLASRPVDRLFLCPECGSYRIPVKELCAACHSPNLRMEDSIHHFRCGYVGPEGHFINSGRAVCPKCGDALRHIGVEYNRPGRIVHCGDCGQWASEPELRAWCVACDIHHTPEQLKTVLIHRYSLTSAGARAARAGRWGQVQAEYLSPASAEPRPPTAGGSNQQYEAMQLLLSIALENHWPIVVYKADVFDPTGERAPHGVPHEVIERTEKSLRKALAKQDLVVRLGRDSFLIVATKSGRHRPPQIPELEHRLAKHVPASVRVTELIPSAALNLLSSGV